jgi:hypothetical protein
LSRGPQCDEESSRKDECECLSWTHGDVS